MIERLQKLLQECSINDYSISERRTVSREAFFVRQRLDQHRAKDVTHTRLTVYNDFAIGDKRFRGSASQEIYPTESDAQIMTDLRQMSFGASFVRNPWYPLADGQHARLAGAPADLTAALLTAVQAIQGIPDTATEKVNSYEIFVKQNHERIVNSQGVDVAFDSMDEMIEIVINAIADGHEIELYHNVRFADQPLDTITAGIREVIAQAKDRTRAVPTRQDEHANVILRGDDIRELFGYFMSQTNVSSIYMHASQAKIGDVLQDGAGCDRITIQARARLDGSAKNLPYSPDGVPASDFTVIQDGVIKALWGDWQHACYLGLDGIAPANNIVVSGGSLTLDQMHAGPYLEIVKFSNFQMNSITGDAGGEIRLAYWHDGVNTVPVTGGSITFNIRKVLPSLRMSTQTRQVNDALVPEAVLLSDIAVSGK